MKNILIGLLSFVALVSCAQNNSTEEVIKQEADAAEVVDVDLEGLQTAYFASGCFWCVEAVFESVEGVAEAISGYSGGEIVNPTYEQVSSGKIKHAEAVKIYYDSSKVSFSTLVDVFFNSHDPSTLNQQGPDRGPQYRSIAFYKNEVEKGIIETKIQALKDEDLYAQITTEVTSFAIFYDAEDYHQDYERNHPNNGYVQGVSIPRLNAFKAKMPEILK